MAPHGDRPRRGTQKVLKNKPKMALLPISAAAARVLCVLGPKSIKKQTILRRRPRAGSLALVAPPASCHWKCPARSTGKLPQKMISTLDCIALDCWIALDCIGLDCIGLHWIALDWIALDCIALDCIGLHCIGLHWIRFKYTALGPQNDLQNASQRLRSRDGATRDPPKERHTKSIEKQTKKGPPTNWRSCRSSPVRPWSKKYKKTNDFEAAP